MKNKFHTPPGPETTDDEPGKPITRRVRSFGTGKEDSKFLRGLGFRSKGDTKGAIERASIDCSFTGSFTAAGPKFDEAYTAIVKEHEDDKRYVRSILKFKWIHRSLIPSVAQLFLDAIVNGKKKSISVERAACIMKTLNQRYPTA